jgi:hypothetical protein
LPGRIFDEDLLASHADNDFVSEMRSGALQLCDSGRQIFDLDLNSILAARTRLLPVLHRLPGSASARSVQQKMQIS